MPSQQVAIMELVQTWRGFSTLDDLHTPDTFCSDMSDSGPASCACGDNCDDCLDLVGAHIAATVPPPLQSRDLLQSNYVEDMCSLTAADNFIMETDQLPNFDICFNKTFVWGQDNVMLDKLGQVVNIDSSFNHDVLPFKVDAAYTGQENHPQAMRTPVQGFESLRAFIFGSPEWQSHRASEDGAWHERVRGQMLTMLTMPAWGSGIGKAQLDKELSQKCGLGQQTAWLHAKKPVMQTHELESVWSRCSEAFTAELTRLASLDLTQVALQLDAFPEGCIRRQGTFGRACFIKADVLAFIRERQEALEQMLAEFSASSWR